MPYQGMQFWDFYITSKC